MHWGFLLLFIIWTAVCVFAGLLSRRLLWPARFILTFICIGGLLAFGFGMTEFVINKGPDDWGSMWHAGYPLSAKYGKFQNASYTMNAFDKDTDGSGSGTYHLRFVYNGYRGTILCHYDKATGKFDHDEIVPDN